MNAMVVKYQLFLSLLFVRVLLIDIAAVNMRTSDVARRAMVSKGTAAITNYLDFIDEWNRLLEDSDRAPTQLQ